MKKVGWMKLNVYDTGRGIWSWWPAAYVEQTSGGGGAAASAVAESFEFFLIYVPKTAKKGVNWTFLATSYVAGEVWDGDYIHIVGCKPKKLFLQKQS